MIVRHYKTPEEVIKGDIIFKYDKRYIVLSIDKIINNEQYFTCLAILEETTVLDFKITNQSVRIGNEIEFTFNNNTALSYMFAQFIVEKVNKMKF